MMESDALFYIWAPLESPWSPWVKPVLFSQFIPSVEALPPMVPPLVVPWAPPADGSTAIVCNRYGATSVATGLALARLGYRPVPLFNALPSPPASTDRSVVDVWSILSEIVRSSPALGALTIPQTAPPAFLLGSGRQRGSIPAAAFDNRSVSFPSDFPSAALLLAAGITKVLLVQDLARTPESDLVPTLHAWQQAGLAISAIVLTQDREPAWIQVRKPSWWSPLIRWSFAALALHGNSRRGFGGFNQQSG